MAETVIVAYEKGSDVNLDYYLNQHVPAVFSAWAPYAKSWKASAPRPESCSPYELVLTAEFENPGDFAKAIAQVPAEKTKELQSDEPNFSKKSPIMWSQLTQGGSF
jgi:hypothetical protein